MEDQLAAQADEIRKLRQELEERAAGNAGSSPGGAWSGEIRGWTRRWACGGGEGV